MIAEEFVSALAKGGASAQDIKSAMTERRQTIGPFDDDEHFPQQANSIWGAQGQPKSDVGGFWRSGSIPENPPVGGYWRSGSIPNEPPTPVLENPFPAMIKPVKSAMQAYKNIQPVQGWNPLDLLHGVGQEASFVGQTAALPVTVPLAGLAGLFPAASQAVKNIATTPAMVPSTYPVSVPGQQNAEPVSITDAWSGLPPIPPTAQRAIGDVANIASVIPAIAGTKMVTNLARLAAGATGDVLEQAGVRGAIPAMGIKGTKLITAMGNGSLIEGVDKLRSDIVKYKLETVKGGVVRSNAENFYNNVQNRINEVKANADVLTDRARAQSNLTGFIRPKGQELPGGMVNVDKDILAPLQQKILAGEVPGLADEEINQKAADYIFNVSNTLDKRKLGGIQPIQNVPAIKKALDNEFGPLFQKGSAIKAQMREPWKTQVAEQVHLATGDVLNKWAPGIQEQNQALHDLISIRDVAGYTVGSQALKATAEGGPFFAQLMSALQSKVAPFTIKTGRVLKNPLEFLIAGTNVPAVNTPRPLAPWEEMFRNKKIEPKLYSPPALLPPPSTIEAPSSAGPYPPGTYTFPGTYPESPMPGNPPPAGPQGLGSLATSPVPPAPRPGLIDNFRNQEGSIGGINIGGQDYQVWRGRKIAMGDDEKIARTKTIDTRSPEQVELDFHQGRTPDQYSYFPWSGSRQAVHASSRREFQDAEDAVNKLQEAAGNNGGAFTKSLVQRTVDANSVLRNADEYFRKVKKFSREKSDEAIRNIFVKAGYDGIETPGDFKGVEYGQTFERLKNGKPIIINPISKPVYTLEKGRKISWRDLGATPLPMLGMTGAMGAGGLVGGTALKEYINRKKK